MIGAEGDDYILMRTKSQILHHMVMDTCLTSVKYCSSRVNLYCFCPPITSPGTMHNRGHCVIYIKYISNKGSMSRQLLYRMTIQPILRYHGKQLLTN
jgi:hypothetical protein